MRTIDENTITEAVLARQTEAPDKRLAQIMDSLVRHLHDFAREVKLTEAEWFEGIRFLTQTGQMCSDKRQEFILLSDTLGLSTLVTAMNNRYPPGCTEATVFGPFHVEGAPHVQAGADIANGAKGEPCFVGGKILSRNGTPVDNAEIQVWQADADGFYDVQYPELQEHRARAILRSGADGGFHFRSILPEAYPIPADGTVGRMLEGLGRHPWRPAHLHFMITAAGHERLITHVFREGGRYLDSDAVFGVRSSLVAEWQRHESGTAPDGSVFEQPFYSLNFDLVLNPVAS